MGLMFGDLVISQTGGLEVIFRGINGLLSTRYEDVEDKVQQLLRVRALLECSNIVRLYLVACVFPVVEHKLPAENVAT